MEYAQKCECDGILRCQHRRRHWGEAEKLFYRSFGGIAIASNKRNKGFSPYGESSCPKTFAQLCGSPLGRLHLPPHKSNFAMPEPNQVINHLFDSCWFVHLNLHRTGKNPPRSNLDDLFEMDGFLRRKIAACKNHGIHTVPLQAEEILPARPCQQKGMLIFPGQSLKRPDEAAEKRVVEILHNDTDCACRSAKQSQRRGAWLVIPLHRHTANFIHCLTRRPDFRRPPGERAGNKGLGNPKMLRYLLLGWSR